MGRAVAAAGGRLRRPVLGVPAVAAPGACRMRRGEGLVSGPPTRAQAAMTDASSISNGFGLSGLPLAAVADMAAEAIVMVDRRQTIVAMNAAALRMFRLSAAEIQGQPLSRLIPDRYQARHAQLVREFDASGMAESRPMGRAPIVGRRGDGEEFRADASISRISIVTGGRPRPLFAAVLRDLSVELDLRRELVSWAERLRTVLDLAPAPMWVVEGDRVALANRAARRLVGADDRAGLVGESVFALTDAITHDALRAHLALVTAGAGDAGPLHVTLRRRDGKSREVEITSALLPDHGATVVQMMLTDVTERQQRWREQERHREELRRLSASVVDAREEERRRIARELHDELGQRLSAMKMALSALPPSTSGASGTGVQAPALRSLVEMVDDTVAAVRRIAADLRPLMLDDLGLHAAIESLAVDAGRRLGIRVVAHLDEDDPPVSDAAAIAVYRMVQEALTNVGRHARATEVLVELGEHDGELILVVRDNGVGFGAQSLRREDRYGLLGIRERALALGGRLEVDNAPGGGGRLTVRLPLGAPARTVQEGA